MALHTLNPPFKIPDDYERLFMLCGEKEFRYVVIADRTGIHSGQMGKDSPEEFQICLDWLAEVMTHIRYDCDETFRESP